MCKLLILVILLQTSTDKIQDIKAEALKAAPVDSDSIKIESRVNDAQANDVSSVPEAREDEDSPDEDEWANVQTVTPGDRWSVVHAVFCLHPSIYNRR